MSNVRVLFVLGLALPVLAHGGGPASDPAFAGAAASTVFRATGNEPGWRLEIGATEMSLLTNFGQTRSVYPAPAPRVEGATRTYAARNAGSEITVTVTDRLCLDSMSGMPHPQTVRVVTGSQTLSGCGGEPASLLHGRAWSVTAIAGTPVVAGSKVTLEFAPDGSLSGGASCNRFVGGYTLSGEGLAIGQPAGTMMMCEDELMKQEHAFLSALAKVSGFSIAADGALVLRTADGRTIDARR